MITHPTNFSFLFPFLLDALCLKKKEVDSLTQFLVCIRAYIGSHYDLFLRES